MCIHFASHIVTAVSLGEVLPLADADFPTAPGLNRSRQFYTEPLERAQLKMVVRYSCAFSF